MPNDCQRYLQDKIQMHLDRMYLLLQRLRRNKNFSRPAFAGLKASSRGFIEVPRPFPSPLLDFYCASCGQTPRCRRAGHMMSRASPREASAVISLATPRTAVASNAPCKKLAPCLGKTRFVIWCACQFWLRPLSRLHAGAADAAKSAAGLRA